jgi:hypothetical protein
MCYIICKIGPMYYTSIWEWFFVLFWHMVFINGFLIPVKKLELLTNLSQWIRGLDVARSYIYIVL